MEEEYRPPTDEERELAERLVAGAEDADEAEERAREFLARHTDLLGPDLIELIANRERQRVFIENAGHAFGKMALSTTVEGPRPRHKGDSPGYPGTTGGTFT